MKKELLVLAYLGIASLMDLWVRRIPLLLTGVFGAGGMFILLYKGEGVISCLPGLLTGALLLAISIAARGAIGRGDALAVMGLAAFLSWQELMETLFCGLTACGLVSLALLVVFHKSRRTELPFVPFLLLGYAGGLFLW